MPIRSLLLIVLAASMLLFSGCGPSVRRDRDENEHSRKIANLKDNIQIKRGLYLQHRKWKGVPYQIGGLNRSGIDCSGFVYLTFKSRFNIEIPRTTKKQARLGKSIKKKKLKAGDLVFFKTEKKVRHVGIYIEDNKFVHASTSNGVIISKLNNVYWEKKYWMARRVKR